MEALDTIAAIATPAGTGAIGIVRISGPDALCVARRIVKANGFSGGQPTSHHLYHGAIVDPADGALLDDVLVTYMQAPASYTGEDAVEINCHGGPGILQKALHLLMQHGARPAGPGEFTRRAFLHGRIDLSRAEAVMDIIGSASDAALKQAARQLAGGLHNVIAECRAALFRHNADIEASIDFPDDAMPLVDSEAMLNSISDICCRLDRIAGSFDHGIRCRLGVQIVIAGKPNVGKSSLFNLLTASDRAIVTPHPGTTRDALHASAAVFGMPVTLIDTAGIRTGADMVESIGIERAIAQCSAADIIVPVFDVSREMDGDDYELLRHVAGKKVLPVCNKIDLLPAVDPRCLEPLFPDTAPAFVSALLNRGIPELVERLHGLITNELDCPASEIVISNVRHKNAIDRTCTSLKLVGQGLSDGVPADLLAVDLRAALQSLGEITGETTSQDILDDIFGRFCIGK